MSDIFLLFGFLNLEEKTFETKKNVFYLTLNAFSVLRNSNFKGFRIFDFQMSSNAKHKTKQNKKNSQNN